MTVKRCLLVAMLVGWTTAVVSQYGKARPGEYPPGYSGNTFTGLAGPGDDSSRTIRIVYVSMSGKMQTFTGKFDEPCSWPAADGKPMKPSDIPNGTFVTAFFNPIAQQITGQKATGNRITGLVIGSWEGKSLPKDRRIFVSCSGK